MAAVETTLARADLGIAGDRAVDWRELGRIVARDSAKGEVLFFGDSLVKFGIVPKVVAAHVGKPTRNRALIGGQPMSSYFLLRRALESGARPAAIVADFHGFLLAQPPRFSTQPLSGFATTTEWLDLAWATMDPDFAASVLLARPLHSLRARQEIRVAVKQALAGDPHPVTETLRFQIKSMRRNWDLNDGSVLLGKNPQFHGQTDDYNRLNQPLFPEDWKCDPVNESYLRRFMALARSEQVPVFWLLPPHCQNVQAGRERAGSNAAYDRFIGSIQAEFPEVVVLDGRRAGFEDALFFDPIHLDREGATVLSVAIAEAIRPHLSGGPAPRTIALARPGGPEPIGSALEDLGQSGASIAAGDAGKVVR